MFVRFRETPYRLQVSLVETRRVDGKVRHQHVASLGSVPIDADISDRLTFWAALHQRLARLSNRISTDDHHKVLAAIHERVPMVMADEQRALQRENAERDLNVWSGLHDFGQGTLADHKGLAITIATKITEMEVNATQSAANVDVAKERLAKIDRGEEVSGGLGKPMTREQFTAIMNEAGFTNADLRHCETVAELGEFDGALEEFKASQSVSSPANERRRQATARAILRRHRANH
jgi:hypothetical protein